MPKATAVFDADDNRSSAALARINGKMLALQSRIAKFAAAFIAVKAVSGTVTGGFDHFRQVLDLGDSLSDLSPNTGVAVDDLVVLLQEFANAGKSAEDIAPVFGKMAKTLQNDSAGDTVAKLGLKLEELKKKTPVEQFRTLGDAINSVRDPSQKAAASHEGLWVQRRGTADAVFLRWIRLGGDGSRRSGAVARPRDLHRPAALHEKFVEEARSERSAISSKRRDSNNSLVTLCVARLAEGKLARSRTGGAAPEPKIARAGHVLFPVVGAEREAGKPSRP